MIEDLTQYDIKPEDFINYLRYYGEHFNKKLCHFACELLGCTTYDKDKVDLMLESHGVTIKQSKLYDNVYVINRAKQCYYGKGIPDEKNLVLYLKSTMECEGDLIFVRFLADMAKKGIPIEWGDMI